MGTGHLGITRETWHTWLDHIYSRARRAGNILMKDLDGRMETQKAAQPSLPFDILCLNYLSDQQQINTSFIMANLASASALALM